MNPVAKQSTIKKTLIVIVETLLIWFVTYLFFPPFAYALPVIVAAILFFEWLHRLNK